MALGDVFTFDDGQVWIDDRHTVDVGSRDGLFEEWTWECGCGTAGSVAARAHAGEQQGIELATAHAATHDPNARVLVEVRLP